MVFLYTRHSALGVFPDFSANSRALRPKAANRKELTMLNVTNTDVVVSDLLRDTGLGELRPIAMSVAYQC